MQVGVTNDLENAALPYSEREPSFRLSSLLKIGQKAVFRIIAGPVLLRQVFVPVLYEDQQTGKVSPSYRVFKVGPKNDFFADIAQKDRELQISMGGDDIDPAKVRSQFDFSRTWVYWAIPRTWPDKPANWENQIIRLEVGKEVYGKLKSVQHEPMPDNPKKLMYGPLWSFDVVISCEERSEKKVGSNQQFNRKYEVKAVPGKFTGKFDLGAIDSVPDWIHLVNDGVFTSEEKELIDGFDLDLVKEREPDSVEAIFQSLSTVRINFASKTRHGKPQFPYPAQLLKYAATRYNLVGVSTDAKPLELEEKKEESSGSLPEEDAVGSGEVENEMKESETNDEVGW